MINRLEPRYYRQGAAVSPDLIRITDFSVDVYTEDPTEIRAKHYMGADGVSPFMTVYSPTAAIALLRDMPGRYVEVGYDSACDAWPVEGFAGTTSDVLVRLLHLQHLCNAAGIVFADGVQQDPAHPDAEVLALFKSMDSDFQQAIRNNHG